MTEQKEPVTLYGSKAERFREVKAQIEEQTGVEPTNPDVVFELLKQYDPKKI